KPAGVGTGLGMAMVYGLVKQHTGYVHLYSEVGQGTTVKLYLPLAHEQPLPSGPSGEEEMLPGGTDAILLVEDDPHLRAVAQRLFEKGGYRVFAAADGQDGLAAYRARKASVDLVITDMVMPKISGMQLYETIRGTEPPAAYVTVLFTSGY